MAESERAQKAMLLLEHYEAERDLEKLRKECDEFTETLNTVRDWLRCAHREYSGFADRSDLESRFAYLNANMIEKADHYRERLNFDRLQELVSKLRRAGDNVARLADQRKNLGVPSEPI